METKGYKFTGDSDCEVLLPLFETTGIETMVKMLDAEFAFVLVDENTGEIFAARDPFGIRPLFMVIIKLRGKFLSLLKLRPLFQPVKM